MFVFQAFRGFRGLFLPSALDAFGCKKVWPMRSLGHTPMAKADCIHLGQVLRMVGRSSFSFNPPPPFALARSEAVDLLACA